MNNKELPAYLDTITGTAEGHLCVAVGLKPYRDDRGKYKHETWSEVTFAWPTDRRKAVDYIDQAATMGDVYVCPYLMKEPERTKGLAAQRVLVHADIDQELDEQTVKDLGGFIVRSGSSGHGHVYIRLAWPVTPVQHEALCRALSGKLGGDHKYSDNDLLRPPGTLNYKNAVDGGDPTPVEAVWCDSDKVDPRELAGQIGVDLANPAVHTATPRTPGAVVEPCPIDLNKYPGVAEALAVDGGDRSADTFRIMGVCRRAGLTLAEATFVVRSRKDLADRLDERSRDDDLAAIWLKLDDEQRRTDRLLTPPPRTAADLDGAALLDEVLEALTKYVIFPTEAASIAVTLWTAATHGLPAWQHATRLAVISPQKRCGKSRLLDIVRLLSFNPMSSTDMSAAVIYRSIGGDDTKTPTLFVDEADALFGTKAKADQNEDLRGLFNAGFQRDRTVWRCVGPNQTPTEFYTFAMAALAAIKGLPDTIVDRSVRIDLKRRKPGETVARFRLRRDTRPLLKLREELNTWVREVERLKVLGEVEPEMPHQIEDREQDAWEPLIAIADAAGGIWPELARAAAEDLCGKSDENDDMQLLADIETIFEAMAPGSLFIPSKQLIVELRGCDESPWTDNELTPHKLARELRQFDVHPRPGPGYTARGYWREDFKDSFSRYNRQEVSDRRRTGSEQRKQADGS